MFWKNMFWKNKMFWCLIWAEIQGQNCVSASTVVAKANPSTACERIFCNCC